MVRSSRHNAHIDRPAPVDFDLPKDVTAGPRPMFCWVCHMSLDVYLGVEVNTGGPEPHWCELYEANITHNLGKMAAEAGIYKHLWRPDEIGVTKASELIEPLREGLKQMEDDPRRFEEFNAPNGWGLYEHFVPWIRKYLAACIEHPKATVRVFR